MPEAVVVPPVVKEISGLATLKAAKGSIDYSEKEEEAPAQDGGLQTPAAVVPVVPPVIVEDPKDKAVKEAQIRQRIAETEAIRAQAERDAILRQQQLMQQQMQAAPPPEPVDLQALYAEDPLKAMQIVAEETSRRVREETLAEINQQTNQERVAEDLSVKRQKFADNIKAVEDQNADLKNPESELYKIYSTLEEEFPYLLTIPEGPLKAIQIAKDRLAVKQISDGTHPSFKKVETEAEKKGKETEAARQESVQVASMVTGPSRGVPPSPSVKLTPDQERAARRLRIAPEQYSAYIQNSPKYFKKEEAPRKKAS